MSVSIAGPQGYEYQYLSSIYLILTYLYENGNVKAYIEKSKGQDLTLKLENDETVEFQFKSRSDDFDLAFFCECLMNFDPRSSSINILSKLHNESVSKFYICTNSRITDDVNILGVLRNDVNNSKHKVHKLEDVKKFRSELLKCYQNEKKDLGQKRGAFVKNQISKLNNSDLKKILSKVNIIEDLYGEKINFKLKETLGLLEVPSSNYTTVIGILDDRIKMHRGNNTDVIGDFEKTISEVRRTLPIIHKNYQERHIEDLLFLTISKQRYLLLTGESFSGKTQTAKFISRKYCLQNPGATFKITSSLGEAENYLLANTTEQRVCLLEDPFGQPFSKETNHDYRKLENLIEYVSTQSNKNLLVTCNLNVLKRVTNIEVINRNWKNLTVTDRSFLVKLWHLQTKNLQTLDPHFVKSVRDIIDTSASDLLFQPGQLEHLANFGNTLRVINKAQIEKLATVNTKAVEERIVEMNFYEKNLMYVFAITSTCISGISMPDLRFILNNEEDFPGINFDENEMVTIGTNFEEQVFIPKSYKDQAEFSIENQSSLERILDNKFIVQQGGQFVFSHPIFEGGAKERLQSGNSETVRRIIKFLKNGIGCLNIQSAINSVRSLYILMDNFTEKEERNCLIEVAVFCLKSTFINVRSEVLLFLVKFYAELNKESQKLVNDKLRQGSYDVASIIWFGLIPVIPENGRFKTWGSPIDDWNTGENLWKHYTLGQEQWTAPQAWNAIKYLENKSRTEKKRIDLDLRILKPFLLYNEQFIVETASYLFAASLNDNNYWQNKYILIEDRPAVRFELMRGLLRAYPYFTDEKCKVDVANQIKILLDSRFVSLRSIDLLTQFNSGHTSYSFDWMYEIEESAVEAMWYLWPELCSIIFENLPSRVNIHYERFKNALENAIVSDYAKIFDFLTTWCKWLEKHLRPNQIHDTKMSDVFLFALAFYLKKLKESQRLEVILQALRIPNLIFHANLTRIIIYNWISFSSEEREHYFSVLKNSSEFNQAIILTGKNCPEAFFKLFLANHTSSVVENDFTVIDVKKLMNCLTVLYIHPTCTDIEYGNFPLWNKALIQLGTDLSSPVFNIASYAYIYSKLICDRLEISNWPSDLTVNNLLSQCTLEQGKYLATCILVNFVQNNRSFYRIIKALFDGIPEGITDQVGSILLDNIEIISYLEMKIPKELLNKYVYPFLKNEYAIQMVLDNEMEALTAGQILDFVHHVLESSDEGIRYYNTVQYLRSYVDHHFPDHEINWVEDLFMSFINNASNMNVQFEVEFTKSFVPWFPKELNF